MSYIIAFLGTFILTIAQIYSWFIISKSKADLKKITFYLKCIMLVVCIFIVHNYGINVLKGVSVLILAIIFCKIITGKKLNNSIILCFISELIAILSESILVIIVSIFFNNMIDEITNSPYIQMVFDFIIAVFVVLISRLNILERIYRYLVRITENIRTYQILLFVLFSIFAITSVFVSTYFKDYLYIVVITNICVSIAYSVIVIIIFSLQNRYTKIRSKYDTTLDGLQAKEEIINEYRIINHENKNQLLVIKSLTKSEKVAKYIDSLLRQKKKFNNEIINLTLKVPEGGIRGLLYSKLLYMKDKGIKCNIESDKRFNSKVLANIKDDDIVDICQILGVFIDNAIEEVIVDSKEISISLYIIDKKLVVSISNKLKTNKSKQFDFKSSKGDNRGYGLKLVKKIVDNNKKLCNRNIITKDAITQKLIITI